jgi:hypothetical protein
MPNRGLPAGAFDADRAADADQGSPEPLPGARLGSCADLSESVSEGTRAAESIRLRLRMLRDHV